MTVAWSTVYEASRHSTTSMSFVNDAPARSSVFTGSRAPPEGPWVMFKGHANKCYVILCFFWFPVDLERSGFRTWFVTLFILVIPVLSPFLKGLQGLQGIISWRLRCSSELCLKFWTFSLSSESLHMRTSFQNLPVIQVHVQLHTMVEQPLVRLMRRNMSFEECLMPSHFLRNEQIP